MLLLAEVVLSLAGAYLKASGRPRPTWPLAYRSWAACVAGKLQFAVIAQGREGSPELMTLQWKTQVFLLMHLAVAATLFRLQPLAFLVALRWQWAQTTDIPITEMGSDTDVMCSCK